MTLNKSENDLLNTKKVLTITCIDIIYVKHVSSKLHTTLLKFQQQGYSGFVFINYKVLYASFVIKATADSSIH